MGSFHSVCLEADGNERSKPGLLIEHDEQASSLPPPPKRLLWGCQTASEHHEYIKEACSTIKDKHGQEGLALLGLEYRVVHHPESCQCENVSMTDLERRDSSFSLDDDDDDAQGNSYMVPIDQPLNDNDNDPVLRLTPSALDLLAYRHEMMESTETHDRRINRVASAASMFSLNTHHTYGTGDDNDDWEDTQEAGCTMRLFHANSGVPLTAENHEDYIAHGVMYDQVARLCMEAAQEIMMEEGNLEWVTVEEGISALVSRRRHDTTTTQNKQKQVLLIITGKGEVRAGVFSRRHLLTSGMECATALPFIRQAVERNMDIVLLDPNAKGSQHGMTTFETSVERLFLERLHHEVASSLYVLAHSMAGSQLVRFLHDRTCNDNGDHASKQEAAIDFLRQIKAVAFTDSNHNVNWTKNNPPVTDLLVGPASLYIKSHRVHEDAKALGEVHHDCDFWKHRFGAIKTLWAGTNEHALTNYTARYYIWDHFDAFLEQSVGDGYDYASDYDQDHEGNDYDEMGAPSF